jgi:hypothetical protein
MHAFIIKAHSKWHTNWFEPLEMCGIDYIITMTVGSKLEALIYKRVSLLLAALLVLVIVVVVFAGTVYVSREKHVACPVAPKCIPRPLCPQMHQLSKLPIPNHITQPVVVQPVVPMEVPVQPVVPVQPMEVPVQYVQSAIQPVPSPYHSINSIQPTSHMIINDPIDVVRERDERVLYDELYPPLGRSNTETTRRYVTTLKPQPTRDTSDTYRLVGYLVDEEDKNGAWKLYAREQHRNGRAEFYATPSNRNNDMKVVLDNSVITSSEKLRDIYTIPNAITVNHPMFSRHDYKIVQLPKGELGSDYY